MRWKLALIIGCAMAGSTAIAAIAQDAPAAAPDSAAVAAEPAPEPRSLGVLTRIVRNSDDAAEVQSAVDELDAMVAAGDADAAFLLGSEYSKARGALPVDYDKAVSYLEKAASLGKPEVYLTLSDMHRREMGGLPRAKALDYLQAAADAGLDQAVMPLADALSKGTYGEPDLPRAISYYDSAVEAGNTDAAKRLVAIYRSGTGSEDDGAMLAKYLGVLADAGDASSMRTLADLYLKGVSVPKDTEKAEHYLRAAMATGDKGAGSALATALLRGQLGADREAEAVALMQSAFDAGDLDSSAALADAYIRGRGVTADPPRAIDILRAGADGGNTAATAALFNLYVRGSGRALAPDLPAARTLFATIPQDERIGAVAANGAILAASGKSLDSFAEMWSLFDGLDSTLQARTGQQILRTNANAYVYMLQNLMTERGHYSGALNGQLGSSTISAINAFCADRDITNACRFGPLARSTWDAISTALAD